MLFWRFPAVVLALVLIGLAWGGAALAQEDLFVPWTQLPASDLVAGSQFGSGALLSGDGSTALITARSKDCAGNPNCGLVVDVFVRDRGAWAQQATLTAPDGNPWKETLSSAISGDGNTALFGVANTDCAAGLDCGIAYAFVRSGGVWTLQQTLVSSDHGALDRLGNRVALSGDGKTALIGANGAPCGGVDTCGAAYVFTRSGNVWTERQRLSGDPTPGLFFGRNLALSADGNTALIVEGLDLGILIGKVFVFTQSGGVWSLQGTISGPDSSTDFANDPMALSGDGNLVMIREDNTPGLGGGSVFVFVRHGATWSPEAVLHGEPADEAHDFGRFPVISDDGQIAVIPTRLTGCSPFDPLCKNGIADVFLRNGGAWNRAQRISLPGTGDDYALGPVALSGDGKTLLLGAPRVPCAAGSQCGTVYAFTSAPLAVGIPALGGPGLAILTLALIAAALIFLRWRRSI